MPILRSHYTYISKRRSAAEHAARAHSSAKLETNLINLRNKKWTTGKIMAIIENSKEDTEVKQTHWVCVIRYL